MEKSQSKGRTGRASAKAPDATDSSARTVTAADLLAGATMPVNLRLNVTIRPAAEESADGASQTTAGNRRAAQHLDSRLRRHTAGLLAWAKRSPANARLALLDPVAAVGRAGVKLETGELRALAREVDAGRFSDVLPAGVEIRELKVVADDRTRAERGPRAEQMSEVGRGRPDYRSARQKGGNSNE